ncbi:MAG: hypothetical protein HY774_23265 [Acidobacteria bacterium]|nr:hypothetical protein [Acidobacteriota bacterium]
MHQLVFSTRGSYDPGEDSITLKVSLSLGTEKVTTTAKLDTGSSACIFKRQIGTQLGLDIESGMEKRFSSVHGTAITYGHFVTLSVLDLSFDVMVYFAADDYFPRNLLGRHGWLDQVRVGLIDYEGLLFLNRYAD